MGINEFMEEMIPEWPKAGTGAVLVGDRLCQQRELESTQMLLRNQAVTVLSQPCSPIGQEDSSEAEEPRGNLGNGMSAINNHSMSNIGQGG